MQTNYQSLNITHFLQHYFFNLEKEKHLIDVSCCAMCSLTSIIFHSHARGLVTSLVIVFPFFFFIRTFTNWRLLWIGTSLFLFFPFQIRLASLSKKDYTAALTHTCSPRAALTHMLLCDQKKKRKKKSRLRPRCHFFRSANLETHQ